jgi:hypothetical protein
MDHSKLELIFDSPVTWNERTVDQFYVSKKRLEVETGYAEGNRVILQLKVPWTAEERESSLLTYVDSESWSQDRLLIGLNGLAALTFCDTPILEYP